MKNYRLIEKRNDEITLITYECKVRKDGGHLVYLVSETLEYGEVKILIGGLVTETKRGWTFESNWLTSSPVKIFLPRQNFTKVEI